jgi:phosphorylase kinase alpha/beta subunit
MLAQMTASGLRIIFNQDEVDFVQNLVYYLGRAYSTPDYGIWERGHKTNHGIRELNTSSIGMALAALEAVNGFDLYGGQGDERSTVHVLPDEIARTEITLKSLLPRESNSKEVDAALLSVIGFPAFAVRNMDTLTQTQRNVVNKLQGAFGCKRFLLDGHQTVLEDAERMHYEADELRQFEHIESEWPLFFTYLLLNNLFLDKRAEAAFYRDALDRLSIVQDGLRLIPELYFVPRDKIEAERAQPGSQRREPNENLPLVWAQSLFILGKLIQDDLLLPADIDPLGRRLRLGRRYHRPVQVAVLAENAEVVELLERVGIRAERLEQVSPVCVAHPNRLMALFGVLGRNTKLGLSGRPPRQMRILTTSRLYALGGQRVVFIPQQLDRRDFYLNLDNVYLSGKLRSEIGFVHRYWRQPGMPLVTLWITQDMLDAADSAVLFDLLREIETGDLGGVPVRYGRLALLVQNAAPERVYTRETLDLCEDGLPRSAQRTALLAQAELQPLDDRAFAALDLDAPSDALFAQLAREGNLYAQIEWLVVLYARHGGDYASPLLHPLSAAPLKLNEIAADVFERASQQRLWRVLRRAADLLGKVDAHLEVAVMDILVRQKQLAVGRAYSRRAIIREPLDNPQILALIRDFCGQDERERILTQELIIYLGQIAKNEIELIHDILTLRVGHLLQLLIAHVAQSRDVSLDVAFDTLLDKPPHLLFALLRKTLAHFGAEQRGLGRVESLHLSSALDKVVRVQFDATMAISPDGVPDDWRRWRTVQGALGRLPADFYPQVWGLLHHCRALLIGDKYHRKNRLDSAQMLSENTAGEMNFALRVDHLLNKIVAPEYRQLVIECLGALVAVLQANPSLRFEDDLIMDVLIGHAVRLAWINTQPDDAARYGEVRDLAWEAFYRRPTHEVALFVAHALEYLIAAGSEAELVLAE